MTCNLTRPSPQDLFNKIKNNFSANVLGGNQIVPESLEWYVVSNDYAMTEEFYSISEQQWREKDPRYACCDNLIEMAAIDGVYPRPAGFSQGYAKLTGTSGASIPNVLQVTFGGQNYLAIGTRPSTMPSAGEAIVRVRAIVPGTAANDAPKLANMMGQTTLTLTGIDRAVTAMGVFCGGSDPEACESFRSRYLERKSFQPRAIESWLIGKIKEWPCVSNVFKRGGTCCDPYAEQTCGCQNCYNQLNFYPIFDGSFPCGLAPQCVIDEMNEWLFGTPQGHGLGQVEIGICGKLFTAVAAQIRVKLTGLGCAGVTQTDQIRSRIEDIFRRAPPSEILTVKSIEIAIAQVLGSADDIEVEFEVISGDMNFTECGDLDPPCDVRPCLGEVFFVNPFISGEFCG